MSNIKINDLDDEETYEETDLMGSFMSTINMDDIDINDDDEPDFDENGAIAEPINVVEVEPEVEPSFPKERKNPQNSTTKKQDNSKNLHQSKKEAQNPEEENLKQSKENQKKEAEDRKQAAELQRKEEIQRRKEELKREEQERKQREEQLKEEAYRKAVEEIREQEKKKRMEEEQKYQNTTDTEQTGPQGNSDEGTAYTGNAYQQARENYTEQAQTEPASDEDMENAYDPENNRKWNNMNHIMQNGRFVKILKKGLILVIAMFICIAIPVAVVKIGNHLLNKDKALDTSASTQESEHMINVFGTKTSETSSDAQQLEIASTDAPQTTSSEASTATAPSVTVQIDVPNVSDEKKNLSSRFPTLNDLSLYINSSTATILMNEKKAMTDYVNGTISKEDCQDKLQACTNASNEILHLLAVNKNLYSDQGQAQQYTSLESDLINVMYYGDVATGLVNGDATIPQIIQDLNMQ